MICGHEEPDELKNLWNWQGIAIFLDRCIGFHVIQPPILHPIVAAACTWSGTFSGHATWLTDRRPLPCAGRCALRIHLAQFRVPMLTLPDFEVQLLFRLTAASCGIVSSRHGCDCATYRGLHVNGPLQAVGTYCQATLLWKQLLIRDLAAILDQVATILLQ